MAKIKLAGGASSKNSVCFFTQKSKFGIEAIRSNDGKIETKTVEKTPENMEKLRRLIFVYSIIKEVSLLKILPTWFFHVPTVIFSLAFLISILIILSNVEVRRYHGAEHKVAHWYYQKDKKDNIQDIQKCFRIHNYCGSNLIGTILGFQLVSSICLDYFGIHIPEVITGYAPLYLYNVFPFNILGLIAQLATTAEPKKEHIEVALVAIKTLEEAENS